MTKDRTADCGERAHDTALWPAAREHLIRYGGDFLPVVIARAVTGKLQDAII